MLKYRIQQDGEGNFYAQFKSPRPFSIWERVNLWNERYETLRDAQAEIEEHKAIQERKLKLKTRKTVWP